MSQAAPTDDDELAGAEQPFMAHLLELRTRLLRSIYGVALVTIALTSAGSPKASRSRTGFSVRSRRSAT